MKTHEPIANDGRDRGYLTTRKQLRRSQGVEEGNKKNPVSYEARREMASIRDNPQKTTQSE